MEVGWEVLPGADNVPFVDLSAGDMGVFFVPCMSCTLIICTLLDIYYTSIKMFLGLPWWRSG